LNVSFLQEMLSSIAERGRQLLPRSLFGGDGEGIEELARALVSSRGEASGVALARQVLDHYRALDAKGRRGFLEFLAREFEPETEAAIAAATRFIAEPSAASLKTLQEAVESPRQELFRRLNLAPGATAEILALRRDLLGKGALDPAFAGVDRDLRHLLSSWFNRGFLVLRRIDWQTPAAILEKIIEYEAVHEIQGWDDLRRRLDPRDRRCFAFFHPSLVDEPLIFVEVALMRSTPAGIAEVLAEEQKRSDRPTEPPTTAVFYSISNCQEGLRGISFGNFLIKQVVEELAREEPRLETFVTLSPVPGFARWLESLVAARDEDHGLLRPEDRRLLAVLSRDGWHETADALGDLRPLLLSLAAYYFLTERTSDGRPIDPVARFHLGNGARLDRINWLGDLSRKGIAEAHGLMVNYRYDPAEIEANHEAFVNEGRIAASRQVRTLMRPPDRSERVPPTIVAKPLRLPKA
jgi:malonyl-CoA decarboxylase